MVEFFKEFSATLTQNLGLKVDSCPWKQSLTKKKEISPPNHKAHLEAVLEPLNTSVIFSRWNLLSSNGNVVFKFVFNLVHLKVLCIVANKN